MESFKDVCDEIVRKGIKITLFKGRSLLIEPESKLTPELRDLITRYKSEFLRVLTSSTIKDTFLRIELEGKYIGVHPYQEY